jgi:hypothetical protein
VSRFPKTPPRSTRRAKSAPPAAINIQRFVHSLWPKAEEAEERCQAMIAATLETIGEVSDAEQRRGLLNSILERAYEDLKRP